MEEAPFPWPWESSARLKYCSQEAKFIFGIVDLDCALTYFAHPKVSG